MPSSAPLDLPRRAIVAVLLLLVSLLLIQAWIATALAQSGESPGHAVNLARLVTLPVLVTLVWLVVRPCSNTFHALIAVKGLTPKIIAGAVIIGATARVMAWAELTARGSLGLVASADTAPPRPFSLAFECPQATVLLVSAVVWLVLVPLSEEFIHRGVLQGWLQRYGTWQAIGLSAAIFAAMHSPSTYVWVFLMGVLFATLFRVAQSLWPPIIAHATYDGLMLVDEVCARLAWNPAAETLPRWGTAIASAAVLVAGAAVIATVLWRYPARDNPDQGRIPVSGAPD